MPILPVVDLLILMGTGSLLVGFLLKVVALATIYRPSSRAVSRKVTTSAPSKARASSNTCRSTRIR